MTNRALARFSLATVFAGASVFGLLSGGAFGSSPNGGPSASAVGTATATPQPGGGKCDRDRDCDGMPNKWERRYGLDPHRNDGRGDPDHDHLSNLNEFLNGGDPTVPDTDVDGLRDGREIHFFHTRVDVADAIVGKVTGVNQCRAGSTGPYSCPVLSLFDATLVLSNADGNEVARTTSDFAGRFNFTLHDAPPGHFRLEAESLLGFATPSAVDVTTHYDVAQRVPLKYSNDAEPGVAGQVTEGPTCGGPQRRDEECIAVLAGAQIDIENSDGDVVASTTSADDGRYAIALDPGSYSVVARAPDSSFPLPPAPVQITVGPGDTGPNHVDLLYETGIL
ncbi:MAG: collagen binding domain-containing protein [Actinomycetota bacterium]